MFRWNRRRFALAVGAMAGVIGLCAAVSPSLVAAKGAGGVRFEFAIDAHGSGSGMDAGAALEMARRAINARAALVGARISTRFDSSKHRLIVDLLEGSTQRLRAILAQRSDFQVRLGHPKRVHACPARGVSAPPGYEAVPSADGKRCFVLERASHLSGADIVQARSAFDAVNNEPIVKIRLSRSGARTFARLTSRNVGRVLAIVMDGKVLIAPVVQEAIKGGSLQINGGFSLKETKRVARMLRLAPLPTGLTLVRESLISP